MPRIFISYRRADSRQTTGRIYDDLVREFRPADVFKDVDNIPPGRDFREVVRAAASQCEIMLVIIGPYWVDIRDKTGKRRLDDPADFVRIEVETGLQHVGTVVIPLLVDGATMPAASQLPDSLSSLAYNNAFTIHDDPLFHHDMHTLIQELRKIHRGVPKMEPPSVPIQPGLSRRWIAAIAVMVVAVGIILIAVLSQALHTPPSLTPTSSLTLTPTLTGTPVPSPTPTPTTLPTSTPIPSPTPTAIPFDG